MYLARITGYVYKKKIVNGPEISSEGFMPWRRASHEIRSV